MTESWKSEEGDSKSTQSLVLQVSKEHHPMGMMSQGTWQNDRHEYVPNVAQENMKHRPELQWHMANWRRPTRSSVRRYRWSHRNSPRAPTKPNAQGDAPPQKRNAHQWRKPSAKTRCKRGDNATGWINETDAKKRRKARSGHSQRASAKPTAEADKATTKKERGMERVSDSDRAPNRGTNARKVADPRRGRTKQRGKNTRWLAASVRVTVSAPAAPGRQQNRQAEAEASPEGEVSKPKKQPADRRQCRAAGPGSRPTVRGAQWRDPRTSQDPQRQWGPPGKKAPAAAGRKAEPPTEAQTPAGRN